MRRNTLSMLVGPAAIAAAGLTVALIASGCGGQGSASGGGTAASRGVASGPFTSSYGYYKSVMGHYMADGMMGRTGYRWMMGGAGYRWMTGGYGVPGWMRRGPVPGFMRGVDPGRFMGRLWAGAPGPRVTASTTARLGGQLPAGAAVSTARHALSFAGNVVRFVAVASPSGGPDETFRIAGMVNPTVVVRAGAQVSIEVINADSGAAHGLVITASPNLLSWMPMMSARPAFASSALWFLGDPTAAGMHAGTVTFSATAPGTYHYLCPVPGHAQRGMIGTFIVQTR
jgi:rusticyanin